MTNNQKVLTGVLAGTAIGLITGILIAPDKGSETRKKISDTTKKSVDSVKDFSNKAMSTVNDVKEKFFGKKNGYEEVVTEDRLG